MPTALGATSASVLVSIDGMHFSSAGSPTEFTGHVDAQPRYPVLISPSPCEFTTACDGAQAAYRVRDANNRYAVLCSGGALVHPSCSPAKLIGRTESLTECSRKACGVGCFRDLPSIVPLYASSCMGASFRSTQGNSSLTSRSVSIT